MTKAARLVLDDCRYALAHHSEDLQGEAFRVSWVRIVALLRAVGHILEKVDARCDPLLAQIIDSEWKKLKATKPEPRILWEFIEQERNNVIKLYEIGVDRGIRINGPQMQGHQTTIEIDLVKIRGGRFESQPAFSHIRSGTFVGRPEKEVAQEAIDWWERYLDNIDSLATKTNP
jgi:hypothetical protein